MKTIALSLIALLLFSHTSTQAPSIELPPLKYGKFTPFPSPLTGMQPGFVFRVPQKGKKEQVPVTILGSEKDLNQFSVAVPSISANWKSRIFLNFVGQNLFGISANRDKDRWIKASFKDGGQQQMLETTIDRLLKESDINFKDGSDYYVINQTISFSGLDYKLTGYKNWAADAKSYIDSLQFKGQIKVEQHKNDTTMLVQNFSKPHRLFYTVLKINKRGSQAIDGKKYDFISADVELNDSAVFKK